MSGRLLNPVGTVQALECVQAERGNQDSKWGQQDHDLLKWLAILTEEVGEFATAVLQSDPGAHPSYEQDTRGQLASREEIIQVAAVAVAIIESMDRNGVGK